MIIINPCDGSEIKVGNWYRIPSLPEKGSIFRKLVSTDVGIHRGSYFYADKDGTTHHQEGIVRYLHPSYLFQKVFFLAT